MKKLLFSLLLLPFASFGQWPCGDPYKGSLATDIHGDTVILKNDNAYRNCFATYSMEVSQSEDTIIWFQSDIGSIAGCFCIFNLSVTIDSLHTGHYFLKAYYKSLEGDTTCYIGLTEFAITKHNTYSSHRIINEYQSDCSTAGIDESQTDAKNDLIVYPNPASDVINILTDYRSDKEIHVFDIQGNEILVLRSNKEMNILDVSDLPPGMYFIKVLNNNKIHNARFCKL